MYCEEAEKLKATVSQFYRGTIPLPTFENQG